MFEVDPAVVNPDDLYSRVVSSAKMRQIPKEFYSEMNDGKESGELSMTSIRAEMVKVYQNLQTMNATWEIREVPVHTSKRFVGPIIILVKKIMRKATRWIFRGYYEQQTAFNAAATRTLSDMIRVQEMLIEYSDKQSN